MSELQIFSEYLEICRELESSSYDSAALKIRTWRGRDEMPFCRETSIEALRRLLSIRLALKTQGGAIGFEALLENLPAKTEALRAEIHFVRGLCQFHLSQFVAGADSFELAAQSFRSAGNLERALLSKYNSFIGMTNSGALDSLDQFQILSELLQDSQGLPEGRIHAWVYRQKSNLLFDEGRFASALDLIDKAIQIFAVTGPLSDLHLSVLQACDCHRVLNNLNQARIMFTHIPPSVDSRVEFVRDSVGVRLGLIGSLAQEYRQVPSHWQKRHELWSRFNVKIEAGTKSKTNLLLHLLKDRKWTKTSLCEALWPEQAEVSLLDNRLHRLVNRINSSGRLIFFSQGHYHLSEKK